MSKGRYYSLEEARKTKDYAGFAREHPSTGDKRRFDALLDVMVRTPELGDQTTYRQSALIWLRTKEKPNGHFNRYLPCSYNGSRYIWG